MPWTTPFPHPITLKDGRVLTNLGEAGQFILTLSSRQQENLAWRYAVALLIKANHSSLPGDIFVARLQMRRALLAEGLI